MPLVHYTFSHSTGCSAVLSVWVSMWTISGVWAAGATSLVHLNLSGRCFSLRTYSIQSKLDQDLDQDLDRDDTNNTSAACVPSSVSNDWRQSAEMIHSFKCCWKNSQMNKNKKQKYHSNRKAHIKQDQIRNDWRQLTSIQNQCFELICA